VGYGQKGSPCELANAADPSPEVALSGWRRPGDVWSGIGAWRDCLQVRGPADAWDKTASRSPDLSGSTKSGNRVRTSRWHQS